MGNRSFNKYYQQRICQQTTTIETENTLEKNIPTIRINPYIIQIGFDWGSSYSKCIYRDTYNNKSYIYTFKDTDTDNDNFLLSSTILFKNNCFLLNKSNKQYPNNGLWNIKKALVDIIKKNYLSITLKRFNQLAYLKSDTEQQKLFIKSCAVFYISRILNRIRNHIINKYHNFGKNKKDTIYVNMSAPISNISDTNDADIIKEFRNILGISWYIACKNEYLADSDNRENIEYIINQNYSNKNFVFNIYPETIANIQTLYHSFNSSKYYNNIYIMTDIGSCYINQFCLYLHKEKEHITYLFSNIFPYGYGIIEFMCNQEHNNINLQTWKYYKENCIKNNILITAINTLFVKLVEEFRNERLNYAKNKNLITNSDIRNYFYAKKKFNLIFSGGGNIYYPYMSALFKAFSDKLHVLRENITTNIKLPNDITVDKKFHNNIGRLYIAYGLSFLSNELNKISYPKTIKPNNKETKKQNTNITKNYITSRHCIKPEKENLQTCPYCHGQNSMCLYCDGKGVI